MSASPGPEMAVSRLTLLCVDGVCNRSSDGSCGAINGSIDVDLCLVHMNSEKWFASSHTVYAVAASGSASRAKSNFPEFLLSLQLLLKYQIPANWVWATVIVLNCVFVDLTSIPFFPADVACRLSSCSN